MDNGKRITKFVLNNSFGVTMVELVVTIALAGIVTIGLLMMTKSKDSFLKSSSDDYDAITSIMLPIKTMKRDISLANKITLINQEIEMQTSVFRNDKLEEYTITYKNGLCQQGVWGKSAEATGSPLPPSSIKAGDAKLVPCLIRTNKSSLSQHVENFLEIKTARFCKGGSDFIGDCKTMKTDMPEEYNNTYLQNSDLSERRFMAEFTDRKNRTIAFTVDLGNLYDETLQDKVQVTR